MLNQFVTNQRKDRMKNIFIALLLASAILFGLPLQAKASWQGRANTAAALGAAYMVARYQATGNVGLPYPGYGYPYTGGYGYGGYGYNQPQRTVCTCTSYPVYSTYANQYGAYGNYGGGYGNGMGYGYPTSGYGNGMPYGYPSTYGYPSMNSSINASNNLYWLVLLNNSQNRTVNQANVQANLAPLPSRVNPASVQKFDYDAYTTPLYDYNATSRSGGFDYDATTTANSTFNYDATTTANSTFNYDAN